MSIIVSWDDDNKNIGRLDFYGQWTVNDLAAAAQQINAMADDVGHPIGLIIDVSDSPTLPDNVIDYAARIADMRASKLDHITHFSVVGSNMLGKTLFKSFCKVCHPNQLMNKVSFANSLDEARHFLAQHQPICI